jgi:hypothetical protein
MDRSVTPSSRTEPILPGRRVGTADEVAQVILMLMTNDDLTGEVVHVDRRAASCHTA